MISGVWSADEPVNQPWGPTTVVEEPIYQGHHWHCGIDIGGPGCKGKPIFAARAGVVTTYTLGILGITTADGEIDFYVHGEYSVSWKASVARGQQIGVFSNVVPRGGASFGPHLHFEVQPKGGWINVPPGLDPVPVLEGGDFLSELTASEQRRIFDQVNKLSAIATQVAAIAKAVPADLVAPDLTQLKADVAIVKATLIKIESALKGA